MAKTGPLTIATESPQSMLSATGLVWTEEESQRCDVGFRGANHVHENFCVFSAYVGRLALAVCRANERISQAPLSSLLLNQPATLLRINTISQQPTSHIEQPATTLRSSNNSQDGKHTLTARCGSACAGGKAFEGREAHDNHRNSTPRHCHPCQTGSSAQQQSRCVIGAIC